MKVSIVMPSYKRAPLLRRTLESIYIQDFDPSEVEVIVVEDGDVDGGETRRVCSGYPVRYFQRTRRPDLYYANPSRINNMGIKQATGEIVVLQGSEVEHCGNVIQKFCERVKERNAVIAAVEAVDVNRNFSMWYTHSTASPRPFFFCGAMRREHFFYLRGFDERFVYYGFDDDQFADRARKYGITFEWHDDIHCVHQWHSPGMADGGEGLNKSQSFYIQWHQRFDRGEEDFVANLDKEWGIDA